MKNPTLVRGCAFAALAMAATLGHAQTYRWHLINLDGNGLSATGNAINDSNVIAVSGGYYDFGTGTYTAVPPLAGQTRTPTPVAINNSGQVAGSVRLGSTATTNRAFRWSPGDANATNLGTLGGENRADGFGINNLGQVVGSSRLDSSSASERAALFSGGTVTNLATTGFASGQNSIARDINDSGLIVGVGRLTGQTADQALVFNGSGGATSLGVLTALGHDRGQAFAVNNAGVIIGQSSGLTADTRRAVRWVTSTSSPEQLLSPVGVDGSTVAQAMNEFGNIVGTGILGGTTSHAIGWINGNAINFNNALVNPDSNLVLRQAFGINSNGYIVGQAFYNDILVGFVLTPEAIPEPATMTLLAGLALVARRRKTS
jgi:probable HAF family extracellular repeat protein